MPVHGRRGLKIRRWFELLEQQHKSAYGQPAPAGPAYAASAAAANCERVLAALLTAQAGTAGSEHAGMWNPGGGKGGGRGWRRGGRGGRGGRGRGGVGEHELSEMLGKMTVGGEDLNAGGDGERALGSIAGTTPAFVPGLFGPNAGVGAAGAAGLSAEEELRAVRREGWRAGGELQKPIAAQAVGWEDGAGWDVVEQAPAACRYMATCRFRCAPAPTALVFGLAGTVLPVHRWVRAQQQPQQQSQWQQLQPQRWRMRAH